jgi:hypothetical protein
MIRFKLHPTKPLLVCVAALLMSMGARADCPPLQEYYPSSDAQWPQAEQDLAVLMPECLESAEYFALYGAALLNTGQTAPALEALERALLLDPENGAARVDYAQALYLAGQLFPALEVNNALLQRADLPPSLASMLQQRKQSWTAQTRSRGVQAEVTTGYDNNLNGGPSRSDFTLTLSGEQIPLTLGPEFQPVSGPYISLRVNGIYQRLTPERNHDVLFSLRNRISEHNDSDLLQFDWRYGMTLPEPGYQWELMAGGSHVMYGGNPLYTATEMRVRRRIRGGGCRPQYELAAQHQLYHGQSLVTGIEASATAGLECPLAGESQLVSIEAGPLTNRAMRNNRPGGDRNGWKLRLSWQWRLGAGLLSTQFNYARLNDKTGYSDLLEGGARRQVDSTIFRLQYTRPLQENLIFLFNFTQQNQGSNIGPFENRGTAADLGISYNF